MASLLPSVRLNPASERSTVDYASREAKIENPKSHLTLRRKASSFGNGTMSNSEPRLKLRKRVREKREEALEDMEDLFSEGETQKIRVSLLDWYDKNQRDLPWRRRRSENGEEEEEEGEKERRAYEVWVSEVMLQQTRVQTVMEYYKRWTHKWPTIDDLAQASLEEVNDMWAGLGYYRRARFLLEMIVAGKEGFPNQASALRKVKGIGEYTAGAIASIAFGEVVPVVDGNVIRVLSRLKAISANPKDRNTVKNFWKLAAQLVDPSRPGDFNQSLMELGATLCTPLNPGCSSCPVSVQCRAYSLFQQNGRIPVTDYPTKVVKAKQKHDFCCVSAVEILNQERNRSGSRFLLVKRPNEGLLAGLWEFPSVILNEEADLTSRRKEIDRYLRKTFQLELKKTHTVVSRKDLGEFVHIFTHIRRKVYVELLVLCLEGETNVLLEEQSKDTQTWKFADSDVLSTMGLTSAVRKVYLMVEEYKKGLSLDSTRSSKTITSRSRERNL
ncbi:PREDICTED: adenine DNA glycosylase isoform X2 [Tarenaya hassleriana]|uniref:adenine DNA glycosylase isoform X2 n=1 Tax=Tarenaya hassleriana TaxID=28532 RepID=UPI00053C7980|nr:PREDICTED: adenine DNA glycosylase isoform X2 [Tarenaya hassleriana]